jgi:hypothetical protein
VTLASQFSIGEESTYATAVALARHVEFVDESISSTPGRIKVRTRRAGATGQRGDRVVPFLAGASGSVSMPVLSKGHGMWLKHALGTAAIGTLTDSAYTQTFTLSANNLTGKSLTVQADRPFAANGASQAFTWAGVKIVSAEWRLVTGADGYLMATYDLDAATETTATALASATYPAAEPLIWPLASVTIGGSQVEVAEMSIRLTNAVKTDRVYLRNSSAKKEQLENGDREVTASMTLDFDSLTHYNRVVGTTAAAARAAVVLTVDAPTLIGATATARMVFTMPEFQFEGSDGPNVGSSDDPLRITLTGMATFNGTDSPLTVTYRSTDSAV